MNLCHLWRQIEFKIKHLKTTKSKPEEQQIPTRKCILEYFHFMEIIDPPPSILWTPILRKNPKDVNHGASRQIMQPVKYSQILDQRHQPECLYRMKSLVRKNFKGYCHCNQWFAVFFFFEVAIRIGKTTPKFQSRFYPANMPTYSA